MTTTAARQALLLLRLRGQVLCNTIYHKIYSAVSIPFILCRTSYLPPVMYNLYYLAFKSLNISDDVAIYCLYKGMIDSNMGSSLLYRHQKGLHSQILLQYMFCNLTSQQGIWVLMDPRVINNLLHRFL